jgi:hypothetical protein
MTGPTVVLRACATSKQVASSPWKMKDFVLPASSELASDGTVFGPTSSCAPPFKNAVPFFLLGDHPVYQPSSRLRLARTQRIDKQIAVAHIVKRGWNFSNFWMSVTSYETLTNRCFKREELQNSTSCKNGKCAFIIIFKDMSIFIKYLIRHRRIKLGIFFIQSFN